MFSFVWQSGSESVGPVGPWAYAHRPDQKTRQAQTRPCQTFLSDRPDHVNQIMHNPVRRLNIVIEPRNTRSSEKCSLQWPSHTSWFVDLFLFVYFVCLFQFFFVFKVLKIKDSVRWSNWQDTCKERLPAVESYEKGLQSCPKSAGHDLASSRRYSTAWI